MIVGLAPMYGITDLAYRLIVKQIFEKYNTKTDRDLMLWTEFMSADGYMANPLGVIKHMMRSDFDKPLVAQIFSGDKQNLVNTAKDIQDKYNFKRIELNMCCPAKNVVQNDAGSALMKDRKHSLDIIKSMSKGLEASFSIKARNGYNQSDKKKQMDFLIKASEYCDMISVHSRPYTQKHAGSADWEWIYTLKEKIGADAKIIGNGGIAQFGQIQSRCQNLDGVMVGRGSIGNPWVYVDHSPDSVELFETIKKHLDYMIAMDIYFDRQDWDHEKKILRQPTVQDLGNIIKGFEDKYKDKLKESHTVMRFRKHLFAYLKGLANSRSLKQDLTKTNNYFEVIECLKDYLLE